MGLGAEPDSVTHVDPARRPRSRARRAPGLMVVAGAAALAVVPVMGATALTTPPSAIGSEFVTALAVSPVMTRTGLVVAMGSDANGKNGLFVTHDSGATWHKAAAAGWNQGKPFIGTSASGHDTIFAAGNNSLVRSDDGAETFTAVSTKGGAIVSPEPSYPQDGAVVVTGSPDFVHSATGERSVRGSGGTYTDWAFALSPAFPSGSPGRYPALLTAIDQHGMPVVQQCGADLGCSGATSLPGSVTFSAPVTLHLSSTYPDDGVAFAQSGRGAYKSVDGGTSFVALNLPPDGASVVSTPMMAVDPAYRESGPDRTVFVSEFETFADPRNPRSGGGLLKSSDGGITWHKLGSPSPLDGGSVAVAVASNGRLFAAYLESSQAASGQGLLCSADGGSTWNVACPALGSEANDPGAPKTAGGQRTPAANGSSGGSGGQGRSGSTPGAGTGTQPGGSTGGGTGTGAPGALPAGVRPGTHSSGGVSGGLIAGLVVLAAALGGGGWMLRRRRAGVDRAR